MNIRDQHAGRIHLISWAVSFGFMLLLYLLLGVFQVRQPQQNEVPEESLLRWVRTIVPVSPQERIRRIRVRERISQRIPTIEPRNIEDMRSRLPVRHPRQDEQRLQPREDREAPVLKPRERNDRPGMAITEHWTDGLDATERQGVQLDLQDGGSVQRDERRGQARSEGSVAALPRMPLDPVLARFLGCAGSVFPGGTLMLDGRSFRFWICENEDVTRALLRQDEELHALVLAGEAMRLQSYRKGVLEDGSGQSVVRSLHASLDGGEPYRQALVGHLETLR